MAGDGRHVEHIVLYGRICPKIVTFLPLPQSGNEPRGKGVYEKSIALRHKSEEIQSEGQESGGVSQKR